MLYSIHIYKRNGRNLKAADPKDRPRPHELLFFTPMPQNKFATEPQVEVVDQPYFENAERVNGQLAMLGFVAAIGSYLTTGQIIPGIF